MSGLETKQGSAEMKMIRSETGRIPLIIVIAVGVVLLLGAGFFGYTKLTHAKGKHKAEKKPKVEVEHATWKMSEFVVNLADRSECHYVKVEMVLEVEIPKSQKSDKKNDGGGHGGGHGGGGDDIRDAKARDAVITCFSGKYFADLLADKDKSIIKKELTEALNEALHGPKVTNIYFTAFAMQ